MYGGQNALRVFFNPALFLKAFHMPFFRQHGAILLLLKYTKTAMTNHTQTYLTQTYLTQTYLAEMAALLLALPVPQIDQAIDLFWDNYENRRRVVFCGNGGSAATASHLPADFQKNMFLQGGRPWECLSLVDSLPLITAWSNDTEYAQVFSSQARTWLRPGDLLVAISGSGNSPNVLAAVEAAHDLGAITLGWSGFDGGKLAELAQHNIVVAKDNMQMVEDAHVVIGHLIYTALRDRLLVQPA